MLHTTENRQAVIRLVRLMSRRSPLLFAGAGTSVAAGYPQWGALLDELDDTLRNLLQNTKKFGITDKAAPKYAFRLRKMDDVLWRAEEYSRLMPGRVPGFLQQKFAVRYKRLSKVG